MDGRGLESFANINNRGWGSDHLVLQSARFTNGDTILLSRYNRMQKYMSTL